MRVLLLRAAKGIAVFGHETTVHDRGVDVHTQAFPGHGAWVSAEGDTDFGIVSNLCCVVSVAVTTGGGFRPQSSSDDSSVDSCVT